MDTFENLAAASHNEGHIEHVRFVSAGADLKIEPIHSDDIHEAISIRLNIDNVIHLSDGGKVALHKDGDKAITKYGDSDALKSESCVENVEGAKIHERSEPIHTQKTNPTSRPH